METGRKTLVTGGVRSGKSRYAERLLDAEEHVSYVATGPYADPATDADWAERIALHRQRRPAHWTTIETTDLAATLAAATTPTLVDSLGTWLTGLIDRLGTWDQPYAAWAEQFDVELAAVLAAWRGSEQRLVAVTNEVGWGIVSEHRSGRLFADLLGRTNAELAAGSDEVVLLVAGRPLYL